VLSYRSIVVHFSPQLNLLDDAKVTDLDRQEIDEDRITKAIEQRDRLSLENKGIIKEEIDVNDLFSNGDVMSINSVKISPSIPQNNLKVNKFLLEPLDLPSFPLLNETNNGDIISSITPQRPTSAKSIHLRNKNIIKTQHIVPADEKLTATLDKIILSSSELTHGSDCVLAGNAALSMRRRMRELKHSPLNISSPTTSSTTTVRGDDFTNMLSLDSSKPLPNIPKSGEGVRKTWRSIASRNTKTSKYESPSDDMSVDDKLDRPTSGESARSSFRDFDDTHIINMLKKKPKLVQEFVTRDGFQCFFDGIDAKRMSKLLRVAFNNDEAMIERRMSLLQDHLK
jgi:hypothetical protein